MSCASPKTASCSSAAPTPLRATANRPRESAETFVADGWVHTGDLGELDAEGRLRLLGRKKEMIVSANGHNVAPARLESALLDACLLILHACAVGEGRPHMAHFALEGGSPEGAM
jgi:long-subunit acyl-CoA synthetase (AMP-forming)